MTKTVRRATAQRVEHDDTRPSAELIEERGKLREFPNQINRGPILREEKVNRTGSEHLVRDRRSARLSPADLGIPHVGVPLTRSHSTTPRNTHIARSGAVMRPTDRQCLRGAI